MNKDTEKSMFNEFKEVYHKFEELTKERYEGQYPAMIVLEKEMNGKNNHAIIGSIEDLVTLFEWAFNLLSEGYKIDFDDFIKLIQLKHAATDHILVEDIKEEVKGE